jgi:thiamine pyrophosphate-dependent acetolactate synthase large subunit-like protein
VERPEDLEPALQRAKEAKGPTVVCVKTDRDANLAVPQEFLMRFVEVYQGPQG